MTVEELRYLAVNGLMHGNGFPAESLAAGLERDPAFVGVDAGSIDAGPHYLGSGENMHASRDAAKEVLRTLLLGTRDADIPLLVGSAATAGIDAGVDWTCEVVTEIASEEDLTLNLAAVYAEQSVADLTRAMSDGRVEPLDESPPLTRPTVEASEHIVAMMGPEPYVEALERGADVVIAGRSSDVAIFEAVPLREGFAPAPTIHLAKTVECGGLIALPRTGGDVVVATLTNEWFRVEPAAPEKRTDPTTVASHLLYETADPSRFVEPRGVLDPTAATYEAVDDRTVEVRGSQFEPCDEYTVKLEGARKLGHRGIAMAGIRDPGAIAELESLLGSAQSAVDRTANARGFEDDDYRVSVHVYGRDGVMGDREPTPDPGEEVGVFVDAVAPTPEAVDDLLEEFTYHLFVSDFPGRQCTAGNAAFPMSPAHAPTGPAFEFSVWHRLTVADPLDPFTVAVEQDVGGGSA